MPNRQTTPLGMPAVEPDDSRSYGDAQGRRWTVTEEPTPAEEWSDADRYAHSQGFPVGWLQFRCGAVRRLLRLYPKQWRALDAAGLDRLRKRARAIE